MGSWDKTPRAGGGGNNPWEFSPESYGAIADGTTDCTAGIKACVAACVAAGIANGSYYGVVKFKPGIYQLSGPLTQGGATKGNALIPLPVLPDTGKKFILAFQGMSDQAVQWHWNQTVAQDAGTVLRTNVAGTLDATYGPASVIGGPTPQQGYGGATNVWSNMMIVIDGIEVMVPNDPFISGFDFGGIAEMNFKNGSYLTNATTATRVTPTSGWSFGLRTPENNNNANSRINKYGATGAYFGGFINEHCEADHLTAIYCVAGFEFGTGGLGTGHGIHVGHICVEACQVGIGVNDGAVDASWPCKMTVDTLDFEFISFAVVNDPGDRILGVINNVSGIGASETLVDSPTGGVNQAVRGAHNARVYDRSRQKGIQGTSPGVPATTVALRNPYFRDCFFRVTGGTVTNVQVTDSGGTAQSVATATNTGWIPIPTGAYVTLTYSVAPTWQWMIL